MMNRQIIIGADICPTENNYTLFQTGNVQDLIGTELQKILNTAKYSIFNLEVPLFDGDNPILKCGPNLKAPTNCINGIKKINPYFFTLANNHIMDHGERGLESTIRILKENNISFSGVGENIDEASKPFI